MVLTLIITFVLLALFCFFMAFDEFFGKKISSRLEKTQKNKDLSWPSKQVMEKFQDLPSECRPDIELKSILMALDVKNGGKDAASQLFWEEDYHYSQYRFRAIRLRDEPHETKAKREYVELAEDIEEILKAYRNKERAIEISGVQPSLDMLENARESLKTERMLLESITKELEK